MSVSTYIYFIQIGNTWTTKVGCSRNPKSRLRALQTANPEELHLKHIIEVHPEYGDFDVIELEHALHKSLNNYHIRGEWFDFNKEGDLWRELKTLQRSDELHEWINVRGKIIEKINDAELKINDAELEKIRGYMRNFCI